MEQVKYGWQPTRPLNDSEPKIKADFRSREKKKVFLRVFLQNNEIRRTTAGDEGDRCAAKIQAT